MTIKTITPPTTEPVTLQEVKDQLRIVHDEEDDLITAYIVAARRYIENVLTYRTFIEKELHLSIDEFPSRKLPTEINLPYPPAQEVMSISYKDKDGEETTISDDKYIVDTDSEPARIVPASGESWPTEELYPLGAVKIRYKAGYSTYTGEVNVTNGGENGDPYVNVSWQSGDKFNTDWQAGQRIIINHKPYKIKEVTDEENLTIQSSTEEELSVVDYSVNFVPEELKQAVLMLAAHFYEHREPVAIGATVEKLPLAVNALTEAYRAWGGG